MHCDDVRRRKWRVEFQLPAGARAVAVVQRLQCEVGDPVQVRRLGYIEPDLKISCRIVS